MGRQSPAQAWRIKHSRENNNNRYTGKLVTETGGTYVVEIDGKTCSIPKSVTFGEKINGNEITLTIPDWLARREGLKL